MKPRDMAFAIVFSFGLLVGVLIRHFAPERGTVQNIITESTPAAVVQLRPTATAETWWKFIQGQALISPRPIDFCWEGRPSTPENPNPNYPCGPTPRFRVDAVIVNGPPQKFRLDWYWPVMVFQGSSVYAERTNGWIRHDDQLVAVNQVPPRPKINLQVGDRGRLDFNFRPRKTPDGELMYGGNITAFGGDFAEILEIGEGAKGIYWCRVRIPEGGLYQELLEGWIPCEIQKQ